MSKKATTEILRMVNGIVKYAPKCEAFFDECPIQRKEVKSLFHYYDFFKAETNLNSKHMSTIQLDYSKISNVVVDGIDHTDCPDYCDAYILSADYGDREMTEDEIEVLNEDSQFVHEAVWNHIF